MQLHLRFSGGISLPLAYRHYIQSMIYDALRGDPDYSEAVHNGGESPEGRHFKLFTFSQLEGSYRIEGQRICFPQGAALEIRSAHDDFLWRLFRVFIIGTQVRIGSNHPTITECTFRNAVVETGSLLICTVSPIVSYITENDSKTRFLSPEEPQFYSLVTANAQRKWQMLHGKDSTALFSITPAQNACFRKQVTMYKTTRITAWHGQFRLQGDPAMLNLLYHAGLGAKSSQGFGMFSALQQRKP